MTLHVYLVHHNHQWLQSIGFSGEITTTDELVHARLYSPEEVHILRSLHETVPGTIYDVELSKPSEHKSMIGSSSGDASNGIAHYPYFIAYMQVPIFAVAKDCYLRMESNALVMCSDFDSKTPVKRSRHDVLDVFNLISSLWIKDLWNYAVARHIPSCLCYSYLFELLAPNWTTIEKLVFSKETQLFLHNCFPSANISPTLMQDVIKDGRATVPESAMEIPRLRFAIRVGETTDSILELNPAYVQCSYIATGGGKRTIHISMPTHETAHTLCHIPVGKRDYYRILWTRLAIMLLAQCGVYMASNRFVSIPNTHFGIIYDDYPNWFDWDKLTPASKMDTIDNSVKAALLSV